jgi:VanZ family protein
MVAPIRDMASAKDPCTVVAQSAKPLTMTLKVFFRWVAWLLVLAIAVFTLTPIQLRPVTAAPVSLERFAAFVALGAAFCLGYPKHRLYTLVLLIGIVGFLEVAQDYVPGRHGRLSDGLVKASGALLGAAFSAFISRYGGLLREPGADEEL